MEKPFIKVAGKKVYPASPKMKVWRAFLKAIDNDIENASLEEFIDNQIDLIITGFGKPDIINRESIDENVDMADIVPLVKSLFAWIQTATFEKLQDLPKNA